METPNQKLINKAFNKYNVRTYRDLARLTKISNKILSRAFDGEHKILSPVFKLILEHIPPQELHSFLQELYTYYYNCENNDVVL